MKIGEIRQLTDEELRTELARMQRRLFDIRAQAVTEKLESPSLIQTARRDIARTLTVLAQRQAIAASESAGREGD